MARCKICGQTSLVWDDNWAGKAVLREPDTQLPHHCVGGFRRSFVPYTKAVIGYDDWVCGEHGKTLVDMDCPVRECKTDSRVRNRIYLQLKRQLEEG